MPVRQVTVTSSRGATPATGAPPTLSNMRSVTSKARAASLVMSSAVVLLAGCGASTAPAAVGATTSSAASSSAGAGPTYPMTVQDVCGLDVAVQAPPRQAIALEQGATEVMLSLGLQDRMVGTSYLTDPVLPGLSEAYAKVPVLAKLYPAPEVVRSAEPDFVYSMLSSAFTPEVAGSREELAGLGVPAYVTRMNCEDPKLNKDFTFDAFFQEVKDVAAVFDVPARAEQLIADQQEQLREATAKASAVSGNPTVMWFYSTYNGAPIVAGPGGVPAAINKLVGARNVFDDLDSKWGEVSWETIAARNPDVIVIADLTRGRAGDSQADKRKLLATDRIASQLGAVTSDHLVALPGSALDPSVRSVAAVPTLAQALLDQGFGS